MTKRSTISVAIAAYNGREYLPEQLKSLFEQTRKPDEIIICDDSIGELTGDSIRTMLADAPCRVKYIHNDTRLGVNGNFSKAILLCSEEFIFFCDQDDVWLPEKIAKMAAVLEEDSAAGAVFCNSTVVDEQLQPLGYSLWSMCGFSSRRIKMVRQGLALKVFLRRTTATGHNIAFSTRYKPLLLPFLPQLTYDIGVAILLAAVTKLVPLDEELTLYRVHAGNVTDPGKHNLRQQLNSSMASMAQNKPIREAEFFSAIIERLQEHTAIVHPDAFECLNSKFKHANVRALMPATRLSRLPIIIREVLRCNYFRYSNGLKSILTDIFLRVR